MISFLINPVTRQMVAELENDEKITIHDEKMKEALTREGIAAYPDFKRKYAITSSRIYPTDGPSLFAKAFKECYFQHGLQQQGFFWRDQKEHELLTGPLADQELAKRVCDLYQLKRIPNELEK